MQNLYRVKDLMEILAISRTTAYQLVKSGRVKVRRIGRLVRVTPQELSRFIYGRPTRRAGKKT